MTGPLPESRIPYRGLRTFNEEDAPFFFGRTGEIQNLATQLENTSFLAVVGASGSGKSSLVRAGLIPALRKGILPNSGEWHFHTFTPGVHPIESLAIGLSSLGLEKQMSRMIDEMKADTREFHLNTRLAFAQRPAENRIVWVVDQFEEVFTLCKEEQEQAAFVNNLVYASKVQNGRGTVLITIRADFYHKCLAHPELARAIADHQFTVVPMNENNLRQVVEEPARQVGLQVEPELVEAILEDVRNQPGAMPLLEHALYEVWQQQHNNTLTLAAYRSIGGIKGALRKRVEELYESLNQPERETIQRVMLRLTQPGEGTEDTRRRALMNELITASENATLVFEVVRKFADARLLTTNGDSQISEQVVDVSHEALIRDWPRLKEWIDEDRAGLRRLRRLNEAAQEWEREGRNKEFLYRGARLAVALEWRARNNSKLNQLEREFLDESKAFKVCEEEEREAAQQRELETEKRSSTRLRYFLAGLAILFVVALISSLVAYSQKQQALAESKRNQELLYAATMKAAFQAAEREDVAEVRRLLEESQRLSATASSRFEWLWLWRIYHSEKVELKGHTMAFAPDGKTLALVSSKDGTIELWDVQTWQELAKLKDNKGGAAIAFSPDGKTLASSGENSTVKLWDVQTRQLIDTLTDEYGHFFISIAFSPDGKTLAAGNINLTVKLWDVQTRQPIDTLELHDKAEHIAFSPDGKTLATVGESTGVKLWDAQTRQEFTKLNSHFQPFYLATFSPDGKTLALGNSDYTMLWDVQTQHELTRLKDNKGGGAIAFSPDGKTLATVSERTGVKLWDVQTQQELFTFKGHTNLIRKIAFSPDGKTLASTGWDNTVKLWNLQVQPEVVTFNNPVEKSCLLAFAPDGKTLASAGSALKLWDVETHQELATFHGSASSNHCSMAFTPDGKILALQNGDVQLWDVQTRQEFAVFREQYCGMYSMAFAPDSKTLVSGCSNGTVTVWGLHTKRAIATLDKYPDLKGGLVTYALDGKTLALAYDDRVMFLDMQTQQKLATVIYHHNTIRSVAFAPDGKTLALTDDSSTIKLWNVQTGQELTTLKGHTGKVNNIAFAPNGKTLASGSVDKTVKLWDVQTGQELTTLKGHTVPVSSVAFTRDGWTLASADTDGVIRLWNGALIK